MKLSVLDLAPIVQGGDAGTALRNARDLAQHAEALGFERFWMAEHHSMPGIASAATAVALGFVAEGTREIRVGAGGIMLPNHSPLQVAEQFGTLAALYPGRIDLGLGRAPGTDRAAAMAMRRNLNADVDQFPRDVVELMDYFAPPEPGRRVRAIPGEGLKVPVWILGSSLFGAQLAAALGLPYAFASHFAPQQMMEAVALYRERFRPSIHLDAPYVMLGYNVFAADSDAEAEFLATSMQQTFVALRTTGEAGELQPPKRGYLDALPPRAQAILEHVLSCTAVGSPERVRETMRAFIDETKADELIVTSSIFDHSARRRSYELLAEVGATL
ncbi:LLM class flavin-dependent oxidoreductase [Pseudenhygromyxa sp. WMMC2535]|uniref:LLM class flavin-dependent oxidoreductase n=1 Tax=Pseudenhygromyxa sp. WMMC2535 TaxID=2712867 RepID=UPI001552710F|nr:LLM class flavin-dependent oxidoreductase [Pseudenhygromyxa sp. WMMC2535]NVB37180.1 LLM class flavin-dependent oxidoreductase [Pseudenhygromyxa sp. WMMC2535]